VWLHGLGADGHDFEAVVPQLTLPADRPVRFIFPHAPIRPITVNGGMHMRGWYDISSMEIDREQDREGIEQSEQLLRSLIAQETDRGIPAGNIFLAGFSQGGAVALHTGLRYEQRLAGILALSTYLPLSDSFEDGRSAANQDTPVFMAHGLFDPVVPLQLGQRSRDLLSAAGYSVQWHEYPMPHSVSAEEIMEISRFLSP
jgi:phospholipase/carboxylesterase